MKQKNKLSFGPGAASIILIVVILSMSILGLLSYMTARNNLALSERSIRVTDTVYVLNERAERSFALLDGLVQEAFAQAEGEEALQLLAENLPEGMNLEDNRIAWTEQEETHSLTCAVRIPEEAGEDTHLSWETHRLVVEMEDTLAWN